MRWVLASFVLAASMGACSSSDDRPEAEGAGGSGAGGDSATSGGAIGAGGSGTASGGAENAGGSGTASGGAENAGGSGTASGGAENAGGSGTASGGAPSVDGGAEAADAGPPAAFALSSAELTAGAAFDAEHTCDGANTSPSFTWTAGPAGTLSYAIVFTDRSNTLVHWVIYDIPPTRLSLPASIEKVHEPASVAGAKQTASYTASVRGYLGPCPPEEHTYEFALYALAVATLPGATTATNRNEAGALIREHDLAVATLTGTYARQ